MEAEERAAEAWRYSADDLPPPKNPAVYAYRCCMKLAMYVLVSAGSFLLGLIVFPILKLLVHPRERFRKAARRAVTIGFNVFIGIMTATGLIRVRVDDRRAFKALRSKIVVANHPSHLDVVMLLSLLPNADCIVRGNLTRSGLGAVVRQLYTVNDMGYDEMAALAQKSVDSGACIVIFPEGTRTPRHGTNPYKRGAAHLAYSTGTDIQPVYIGGNDKYGLGKHDKLFSFNKSERYRYDIRLLPPIPIAEYAHLPPQIATRRITTRMHDEIAGEALRRDGKAI